MDKSKVKFSLIGGLGRRKEFNFELENDNEYFNLIEFADTRLEEFIAETGFKFKRLDSTTYKAYKKVSTGQKDNKGKWIYQDQLITVEEFDKVFENCVDILNKEYLQQ